MCGLRNIAMHYYQESVTTGQTDGQTPDKVIPMCRYASQVMQKLNRKFPDNNRYRYAKFTCSLCAIYNGLYIYTIDRCTPYLNFLDNIGD